MFFQDSELCSARPLMKSSRGVSQVNVILCSAETPIHCAPGGKVCFLAKKNGGWGKKYCLEASQAILPARRAVALSPMEGGTVLTLESSVDDALA